MLYLIKDLYPEYIMNTQFLAIRKQQKKLTKKEMDLKRYFTKKMNSLQITTQKDAQHH